MVKREGDDEGAVFLCRRWAGACFLFAVCCFLFEPHDAGLLAKRNS